MINGAIRAIPGLSAEIQMICGRFIPVVGVAPRLPEKNTTKHYDYWHYKSNSGTICENPNDLREIFTLGLVFHLNYPKKSRRSIMINGAIRAIPGLSAEIQMICGRFIPVVGVAPQLPEKNTTKHYDYWHNKSNSGTSCGNPNDLREIFLPARIRLKGVGPF